MATGAPRPPEQMAATLRQASTRLLVGGAVVLVAGVVLLLVSARPVAGWALVGLAVVDLALALAVRAHARRTSALTQEPR